MGDTLERAMKPVGDLHSVPHFRCPNCRGGCCGVPDGQTAETVQMVWSETEVVRLAEGLEPCERCLVCAVLFGKGEVV